MTAVLFGSIGTLADTSELQREAFNAAFAHHGLDWNWDQHEYRRLITDSGGADRIKAYAESRGEPVDADAVHATKSQLFQDKLRSSGVRARPDVAQTIKAARSAGTKVALITTTSSENIAALSDALAPEIDVNGFDLVLNRGDVTAAKPDGEVYRLALERLGESAGDVVAVEDNLGGVEAANAAGVAVVAFPGENNTEGDFGAALASVGTLTPADLPVLAGD